MEGQVAVEIPQYRCHKVVRAAKITELRGNGNADMPDLVLGEIGGIVALLPDWHAKHKPQVGGYYVVYEDGYTSFSPAKAFEDGYTLAPRTHQERVVIEEAELATKLKALDAFLHGPVFASLPMKEQHRLTSQAGYMDSYGRVLRERIDAF
jgi:hypothetical protein